MLVEALYRDGHKAKVICTPNTTLAKVVEAAQVQHPSSTLKFLKVIDHGKPREDQRRVDG